MARTYLERFGLDAVKKHLRSGGRYWSIVSSYANVGLWLFDHAKFANDLGVSVDEFPFRMQRQDGWDLRAAPTAADLDAFLTSRNVEQRAA